MKAIDMKREIKFRAWDGKQMYLPEYTDREDFHIEADGADYIGSHILSTGIYMPEPIVLKV